MAEALEFPRGLKHQKLQSGFLGIDRPEDVYALARRHYIGGFEQILKFARKLVSLLSPSIEVHGQVIPDPVSRQSAIRLLAKSRRLRSKVVDLAAIFFWLLEGALATGRALGDVAEYDTFRARVRAHLSA